MSIPSNHHVGNSSSSQMLLCNSSKSKKSKNDLLRYAVGALLKQKNFVNSERFRKSDLILSQNKTNFIFQKMIDNDLQNGNSFLYSNVLCLTNSYALVDKHFERFSQFIESQTAELHMELKRFYAPILCHIYIDLIKAREIKGAIEFMRKYASLIAPIDTYEAPFPTKINGCSISSHDSGVETNWQQHLNIRFAREAFTDNDDDIELIYFMKLIQKLSACQKLDVLETDTDIMQLRSAKYELHTTEDVVNALKLFLENHGHIIIFHTIVTWIHIHILDNEINNMTEEAIFMQSDEIYGSDNENDAFVQNQNTISISRESSSIQLVDQSLIGKNRSTSHPEITANVNVKTENCNNLDEMPVTMNNFNGAEDIVTSSLQKLKTCSEQIQKLNIELPQVIKIADRTQGLSCASLDQYGCHLVAGFNNSNIQLWQMNQHSIRGRNIAENPIISTCPWSPNYLALSENNAKSIPLFYTKEEENYYIQKFYDRKYADNSYNSFGGVSLRGHGSGITDVKFSNHYPVLFSTSKDTCLRCWHAESFNCAAIYRGHRYPVWCLDESPVGMYVATGSKDLTARLWCLEKEFPLITFVGHTQDVECVAFHPNGNYLATGSADFSLRLWCVTTGKLMRVFSDSKQAICCLAFSPNGKMIAAGGEESKIRIYDLAAGSQLHELKDHSSNVVSINWDMHGNYLASACRDGTLRVWDVKKLTLIGESTTTNAVNISSTSVNRLACLPTSCQRLLKVFFNDNETICCLGSA